uniref:Cytochrome b-c1 complex subunit 6-like n=1 Tax=Rhizophora mucronata TaxID=61149 RepID=A0A2P2J7P1_RHIMU
MQMITSLANKIKEIVNSCLIKKPRRVEHCLSSSFYLSFSNSFSATHLSMQDQ